MAFDQKQAEHRADFDAELVNVRDKVTVAEGPEMRETIQDTINDWFLENRDPNNGDYPDFPEEEDGGSKSILFPIPQVVYPPGYVPEENSKDAGKKDSKESGGTVNVGKWACWLVYYYHSTFSKMRV